MKGEQNPIVPQGWKLDAYLGSGSCGSVYRVVSESGGQRAALKIISIPMDGSEIPSLKEKGLDNEAISRALEDRLVEIFDKYEILSKMNDESNIVSIEDVSYRRYQDGTGCDVLILMEELTPLCDTLDHTFSEKRAAAIMEGVLTALERYGQYRLVHAAVKPENVLVSPSGEYKLSDFGVSGLLGSRAAELCGDGCDFMAPEVFLEKPFDGRADVYSAGLLLYWLCNDYRIPFLPEDDTLENEAFEDAISRRISGGAIPEPKYGSDKLHAVIAKACAYQPEDRYKSAAAMLLDLRRAAAAEMAKVPITPIRIPQQPEQHLYAEPIVPQRRTPATESSKQSPMREQSEPIALFENDFVEKRNRNTEHDSEPRRKKNTSVFGIVAAVIGLMLVAGVSLAVALLVLTNRSKETSDSSVSAQETIRPRSHAPSAANFTPGPVSPGQTVPMQTRTPEPSVQNTAEALTPYPPDTPEPMPTEEPTPEKTPEPTPEPTPLPTAAPAPEGADHRYDGYTAQVANYDSCILNPYWEKCFDGVSDDDIPDEYKAKLNEKVTILASYADYALVETKDGRTGWVYTSFLYAEWMHTADFNKALTKQIEEGLELPKNLEMYGTFEKKKSKGTTNLRKNPYVAEKMDPPEPDNKIDKVGKDIRFTILARRTVDSDRWYFCMMQAKSGHDPVYCWVNASNFK